MLWPRFIEVIEVTVRPGGVNQRRNRVDQELGIQTLGSCPQDAMRDMIHPENMPMVSDPIVVPEVGRT
jgi:hypothetical protein